MYKIQTLNKISTEGLSAFPRDSYEIASDLPNPDAILVRSADMRQMSFPLTVKAVARAGAGVNNIPVPALTERGVVVFNTPGANANAVKELAILSLLAVSRNIISAAEWVKGLSGDDIEAQAEKGKASFAGPELAGKTLGVIGLGAIGVLIANSAVDLGMRVTGYDPFISVEGAWALNRDVARAESLEALLAKSDYVTIHVPQTPETKGLINTDTIRAMKAGARLINLARGGLVANADVLAALDSGKIAGFVSDFASADLLAHPRVICLPHLGASTPEAEDNCARMAAKQIRDFLETGEIVNSVNFPRTKIDGPVPAAGSRICAANRNVPNMVGQITTILAGARLNIAAMVNQNRADLAYNIIDVESPLQPETIERLCGIDGILSVRVVEKR
ncbi:MAG: phosphoglycerate dehydrogenase [Treponema sp.]|jgi:D-3-phosphoglycerate dehydrogenase|nr:phosphoglycerate dehydrogenase [Treponema sp.]